MLLRICAVLLPMWLIVGCTPDHGTEPPATQVSATNIDVAAVRWRAILVAGDNTSPAFDNGIETLRERFGAMGVRNIVSLSASTRGQAGRPASSANIVDAIRGQGGDACLVYLTSHGDERGLFLRADRRVMAPAMLDQALTRGCGSVPTVVVVSACHSGAFINDQTRRPNRIIFAAAASDRTSFGCGADDDYTYYDQCFLQQLDEAGTWAALGQATRRCVETLERRLGVRRQSQPQLFVGAAVANLRLPGR